MLTTLNDEGANNGLLEGGGNRGWDIYPLSVFAVPPPTAAAPHSNSKEAWEALPPIISTEINLNLT